MRRGSSWRAMGLRGSTWSTKLTVFPMLMNWLTLPRKIAMRPCTAMSPKSAPPQLPKTRSCPSTATSLGCVSLHPASCSMAKTFRSYYTIRQQEILWPRIIIKDSMTSSAETQISINKITANQKKIKFTEAISEMGNLIRPICQEFMIKS